MTGTHLLLVALTVLPAQSSLRHGTIGGRVVNATDETPIAGAKVVLRIKLQNEFMPIADTVSGAEGRFLFEKLFVGGHYEYLPGANRDGIHYPGPHVRLTAARPNAQVKLEVCDSLAEPSPLVISRYEILVHPEPGAVHVTESILVSNPTTTCYVGKPADDGAEPVTLELSVPKDFERTTFHQEFFGRRFSVRNGKVVTGIPWTPGQRELKFTYVLRNEQEHCLWERPLDLPCSEVRLHVRSDRPDEVSCNLAKLPATGRGEIVFESRGQVLPKGHVLRVELGRLPVPWMAYGRWAAVAVLGTLVAGASLALLKRRRRAKPQDRPVVSAPHVKRPTPAASQRRRGRQDSNL